MRASAGRSAPRGPTEAAQPVARAPAGGTTPGAFRNAIWLAATVLVLAGTVFAGSHSGTSTGQQPDLSLLSLEELMNIKVISASRWPQPLATAPATLYVLTADEIRLLGARTIPDLLRSLPGVDVMTAWDNEVEVGGRGLSTFQNAKLLVLVDGVRANDDWNGAMRWKDYPLFIEDIARIEVSLSPLSALWGANAFGGTVNIVTTPPGDRLGGRGLLLGGEKETLEYHAAYGARTGGSPSRWRPGEPGPRGGATGTPTRSARRSFRSRKWVRTKRPS